MTGSTFTWLDYDEDQARQSTELIRALSERETVDSIGIGAVRDGISGLLFPGTSTVQTRVRYFLLVPWAAQAVASRRPRDRAKYAKWFRETEVATINQLVSGNPSGTIGIIGRERREKTQRLPSSIYWASIGEWGIRRDPSMTLSAYRDWVLAPRDRDSAKDDLGESSAYLVFDELPQAPGAFPNNPLDVLPSREEAKYLLESMVRTRLGGIRAAGLRRNPGPSLLATVAKDRSLADLLDSWDIPRSLLTEDQALIIHHAQFFSLVMQGARLRYDQLLFREQEKLSLPAADGEGELEDLVAQWTLDVANKKEQVRAWTQQLPAMFTMLIQHGIAIGDATRAFISAWADMVASNPATAMSDQRSARLIRQREESLKAPHHRLGNANALRSWDGALFGSRPLDYRWGIARQLVRDCRDALEVPDARA